jgi:hypothetical protein
VQFNEDRTLPQAIYVDPLGEHELGSEYNRQWLAASAPVRAVNNDSPISDDHSGLVVLVQEDYLAVISPVRQLGERLVREGLLALAVVVLVTILLWYVVLRVVREPARISRPIPMPIRASTPIHAETTIQAKRH